jgi:hypothetical protein
MIPNSIETVRSVRQELIDSGFNIDANECSRFQITKKVAYVLSRTYSEVGLLFKNTGNHCEERAVDIICLKDGTIIDILGYGSLGQNTPLWIINPLKVEVSRWRMPFPIEEPKPIPIESIPASPPIATILRTDTAPTITEPVKFTKSKVLAALTVALGALTWLYNIVKKSDTP